MNSLMVNYARNKIEEGLLDLSEKHRIMFKRMYSAKNLKLPINDVIKNIPEEKLDWALTQVQNTLKLVKKGRKVKEE